MKNKLITIILLNIGLLLIIPHVLADDELTGSLMLGKVEGMDIYFEITDSEYLNVSLQSSEEIVAILESIPKTVSLHVSALNPTDATSLTIGGLEPNKTYYKFEDSYKNEAVFVSNETGSYSWLQDLSRLHHIWIQEINGTVFLPNDCEDYGIWNATTSICTLDQPITESVEITANITLDCDGHSITGSDTGWGIYASYKTNLNIKNCTISNFSGGIYFYSGYYTNLTSNELTSNWYGATLYSSRYNTIASSNINLNQYGIYLPGGCWNSRYNDITENIFEENASHGLYMPCAWCGTAGIILCNEQNNTWQNKFYNTGVHYGGTNSFCEGVGNYYENSVPITQIPSIDCGPTPNNDIYIDQTIPTSFEWDVEATYSSIQEALNNLNTNQTTRIIGGTGPYLEKVQTIRNYTALDCQNETLQGDDTGNGIYVDDNNTTVKNCLITNFSKSIYLHSSDNTLSDNTITSNEYGIYVYRYHRTYNNTITDNEVSFNQYGIGLYKAFSSTITNNKISLNGYGIYLPGGCNLSNSNQITENTFQENTNYGLYISCRWCGTAGMSLCCKQNSAYHNNFIDNNNQAFGVSDNFFDNGYPIDFDSSIHGGNYWSDYEGEDHNKGPNQDEPGSDGIGDTPYVFPFAGQDRYPFMEENGWKIPVNQPPTFSNLNQYKSDEVTIINEGTTTTESTTTFKAILTDPDNDQVKLQVEIKEYGQDFNEQDILESDFIDSSNEAVIVKEELSEGQYRWRARAVDFREVASAWQEFGEIGNVDFEVKLVSLYTQVESQFPPRTEEEEWADNQYGVGGYECKNPRTQISDISFCGCTITSMVMLGRYYDIDTAIDNSNVDPGNINAWLAGNEGYRFDGALWWSKAIEYLGFFENDTTKARLSLDYYNEPSTSQNIDNYVNSAKPIVAYSERFGHYFVVDNKLATTYGLKDPYWYNTKTLDDTRNIIEHIQDYDNYFGKANLFSYFPTPKPITASMFLSLASPAELLVTDPLGRRLGKDPIADISHNEIPDGSYTEEGPILTSDTPLDPEDVHKSRVIYIPSPIDGEYDIQVIGIDVGRYALSLLAYDQNGQSKSIEQQGDIITDVIQEFELNYSLDVIEETEFHQIVEIDIKPGSYPNSINCKNQKGIITVAILTTETFDATNIDSETVRFGPNEAQEAHRDKHGKAKAHLEDVDEDGDLDTVFHFRFGDTGIQCGDQEAMLTGKTLDGFDISGSDSIRTVGESIKKSFFPQISLLLANISKLLSCLLELLQTQPS